MYKWKRDHIQICPKYRDYFSGIPHVLYIFNGLIKCQYGGGFRKPEFKYCLYAPDLPGNVNGEYWNETHRIRQAMFNLWELVGRDILCVKWVNNEYCAPWEYAERRDYFDLDRYDNMYSWEC